MIKRMFGALFMALLLVGAFAPQSVSAGVTVTSQTQQIEGFTIAIPEFRDYDFKKFDCYGCPEDPSMTEGVVDRVNAQKEAYIKAHDAYQESWSEKDIIAASSLAFGTSLSAWPWNNAAWHIIENDGDLNLAKKYLLVAQAILAPKGLHLRSDAGVDVVASNLKYIAEKQKPIVARKKKHKAVKAVAPPSEDDKD